MFAQIRSRAAVGLHAVVRSRLPLSYRLHGCRVYSYNSPRSVANEISGVESKNMRHAVNNHGSNNDEPGACGLQIAVKHLYLRGKSQLWVILIDTCPAHRVV